jgi:hypothetical protein
MLIAESVNGGIVFGRRPIIRPARGKARLGPLTIDQHDHVEGRMASMRPAGRLSS